MTIVGGLRARLIFDSVYNMINDSLDALGWFDAGREHLPLNFRTEPIQEDDEVQLNTLVLFAEDAGNYGIEMGSNLAEHRRNFFLDFYAEGHALGEHVIYDVRDIIQGRMPSISRTGPTCPVYNYTVTPNPPQIATVEFEYVTVDRAHVMVKPWERFWWSCAFTVLDHYGDEDY